MNHRPPSVESVESLRRTLAPRLRLTPIWQWIRASQDDVPDARAAVWMKLELFQVSGSFKVRAALAGVDRLNDEERLRGVVAVSAGNHAAAVAYAAKVYGVSAKVVMPASANPARVELCRSLGAEVHLVDNVHVAFATATELAEMEGRTLLHPFEGETVALGTGTLGLELLDQLPDLDAVVVPIGGGGLCGGVAAAIKQVRPSCQIYGVEPEGADTMSRSVAAGECSAIEQVRTIADSLGAPYALPYSFNLCRTYVDDIVRVSDDELCRALYLLFNECKLAVEPAGAAAAAAALGPLAERLRGRNSVLVVCGANIDPTGFSQQLLRGEELDRLSGIQR